jgi:hypothetical protein
MAAEAMLAMERTEAILPWIVHYRRRLPEHSPPFSSTAPLPHGGAYY